MPGFLLHVGAHVQCIHAGQAQPTASNPRVRVSSQPTVVQANIFAVSACAFNIAGAPSPCVTAQGIVPATRLRSGGQPLLLKDSPPVCAPNGTPLLVNATQGRVRGM
jgi:hypothetical protein